jgi:integrase
MSVLKPIWLTKPETARRVKQRIGRVLDWAKAKGYRLAPSPTHELGDVLPRQTGTQKHQPSLPYAEVPGFIADLRASRSADAAKAALEFLILTATRRNEVLGARWAELDFKEKIWTIPGGRMKGGEPHRVPLSARGVELLEARKAAHSGEGDLVFEAKPGKRLSKMTLLLAMRRMKADAVPHGFRSSFRNWAEERGVQFNVAEACLAHKERDKVVRAYLRTDLLEERRLVMDKWSAHCRGGAKVLKFPVVA